MLVLDMNGLLIIEVNQLGSDAFSGDLQQNAAGGLDLSVAGFGVVGIGVSQLFGVLCERARLDAAVAIRRRHFHVNRSLPVGYDLVVVKGMGSLIDVVVAR